MGKTTKHCTNCRYRHWDEDSKACTACVNMSHFEADPKPSVMYLGHRKDYIDGSN